MSLYESVRKITSVQKKKNGSNLPTVKYSYKHQIKYKHINFSNQNTSYEIPQLAIIFTMK